MRWHVFTNLIVATWTLVVFVLAVWSTDFMVIWGIRPPNWIAGFGFECLKGTTSRWWVEKTSSSNSLFDLHFMIIFMYSTIGIIVVNSIPLRYDRLVLSEKEKAKEKAAQEKKAKKE